MPRGYLKTVVRYPRKTFELQLGNFADKFSHWNLQKSIPKLEKYFIETTELLWKYTGNYIVDISNNGQEL